MELTILTETLCTSEIQRRARRVFRQLYGQYLSVVGARSASRVGGPAVVRASLLRGLEHLGQPYRFNPLADQVTCRVGVLSSTNALRWAIQAKNEGQIKYLVAGPNLVVLPDEHDAILANPTIDLVVTPSRWVSRWYAKTAPQLASKLVEWAAGVDETYWNPNQEPDDRPLDLLVYMKIREPDNLFVLDQVVAELSDRGLSFKKLTYGTFQPEQYRRLLQNSRAVIYLTESESQGIALFEAWACDVPTLVWDRGFFRPKRYPPQDASSAPYLAPECGLRFRSTEDFLERFEAFMASWSEFTPRRFILDNYALTSAAQAYVRLFSP